MFFCHLAHAGGSQITTDSFSKIFMQTIFHNREFFGNRLPVSILIFIYFPENIPKFAENNLIIKI